MDWNKIFYKKNNFIFSLKNITLFIFFIFCFKAFAIGGTKYFSEDKINLGGSGSGERSFCFDNTPDATSVCLKSDPVLDNFTLFTDNMKFGEGVDEDIKLTFDIGSGTGNGYVGFDTTNKKIVFSHNGITEQTVGAGAGGENFLADGGFEQALQFTCNHANQTCVQTTSPNYDSNGSNVAKIDASASSTYDAEYCVTNTEWAGNDFEVGCVLNTTSTLINLCASNDSGSGDNCVDYVPNTASLWLPIQASMTVPASGKACVRITSDSGTTDDVYGDSCYIRNLKPNVSSNISNWKTFTPTGSWVANTTYAGFWRQVGDTIEYEVTISLTGLPTATGLTVNTIHTIDTTKLSSSVLSRNILGTSSIYDDTGIDTARLLGQVGYSTTTAVSVQTMPDGSADSGFLEGVSSSVPITFANNDKITLKFAIPAVGLTSSSQFLTAIQSGNAVIYNTNASQSIGSGGASSIIDFEDKIQDNTTEVTTGASWKYTAKENGDYQFCPNILFNTATWAVGEVITLEAFKNGSIYDYVKRYEVQTSRSGFLPSISGCVTIPLAAAEYADIRVNQNSTGSRTLQSTATLNHISIQRVDKKGIIAAALNEKVVSKNIIKPALVSAYVADGVATTTVSEDDSDFINGNCTNGSAGTYVCSFNSSFWASTPRCWVQSTEFNRRGLITRNGVTDVTVFLIGNADTPIDSGFELFCHGQAN